MNVTTSGLNVWVFRGTQISTTIYNNSRRLRQYSIANMNKKDGGNLLGSTPLFNVRYFL